MTTVKGDVVVALAYLRLALTTRYNDALREVSIYRRDQRQWASEQFFQGRARAFWEATQLVDETVGNLDSSPEVTKPNGG